MADMASVENVAHLALQASREPWSFAAANREAIERHWQSRKAKNPSFYNGRVFVLRSLERTPDGYAGTLSLEAFADFLYWRDTEGADPATLDGFAAALVRSAEGHVLLGRHAENTLNPGLVYLPGGLLDARDERPDGTIDIGLAVARELNEETGLAPQTLTRFPGYRVVRLDRQVAFVVELKSTLPLTELRRLMLDGAKASRERELTDIIVIRSVDDALRYPVGPYARLLLTTIFVDGVS